MRLRPWLRYTLWGALFLSLSLHFAGIFGEDIYAWLTRPEFSQTELRKASRELKAVSLEEDAQQGAVGKKRLGSLDVYLQNVQPLAQSVPMPKPVTRPVQKRSKAALVAVASKPMSIASGVAVSQTASSPVAIPARDPTAEAPVVTGLERFPRELKITYIWEFLPVPAHMTWKVVNGRYDLRLEGSFLGISRTFVSSGKVGKNGVTPERFIEYRNKPEPHYQVDFDWQKLTAEIGEPGSRKNEKIADGDQDIFSAAFHVGLIGSNQPEYKFSMFSGRRKYEDVRLKVVGEAKLRLGGKEVDALLLRGVWDDRQVDFWLAPDWHNIPVRITIVLSKEMTLDIWANEITMEGKTILEWAPPVNQTQGRRSGR